MVEVKLEKTSVSR